MHIYIAIYAFRLVLVACKKRVREREAVANKRQKEANNHKFTCDITVISVACELFLWLFLLLSLPILNNFFLSPLPRQFLRAQLKQIIVLWMGFFCNGNFKNGHRFFVFKFIFTWNFLKFKTIYFNFPWNQSLLLSDFWNDVSLAQADICVTDRDIFYWAAFFVQHLSPLKT